MSELRNGTPPSAKFGADELPQARSEQLRALMDMGVPELCNFIAGTDAEKPGLFGRESSLLTPLSHTSAVPLQTLRKQLEDEGFLSISQIPTHDNLDQTLRTLLKHSINTSAPGFLDKLYAAPLPPGIFAELVLGVLNTNVHVYQVSPVLTLIEKHVTKILSSKFGMSGPYCGGISVQGGSASNMTALTIARNTKFPKTRTDGNGAAPGRLVIFTSAHGHYSIEKAAQAIGLGSKSVITVPVDYAGRMIAAVLETLIQQSVQRGEVPFFVNATAGTTVLGSFDPFEAIHEVTQKHDLWLHVDAAWGGGFVFSEREDLKSRLHGIGLADSIATNPHKMLGIPVTCSFLLGNDLRQFQSANTLKAGYLFHEDDGCDTATDADLCEEPQDLADLTLQCGRRGDALKFFLTLKYYGTDWYSKAIDRAYDLACYAHECVHQHPDLSPVLSTLFPDCLQVCFSFTPHGRHVSLPSRHNHQSPPTREAAQTLVAQQTHVADIGRQNSRITSSIAKRLISRGFMIDYAPALDGQTELGAFFRVVINISIVRSTVDLLLTELVAVGHEVAFQPKVNENSASE